MPSKAVSNPVMDFMTLCKGTEICELFAAWGGLSIVSAALGRRVWLPMGVFNVFPNLYVVLVAASGSFRKSTVINLAEELLLAVEPPLSFISTNLTPEAMHKSMMDSAKEVVLEGGEAVRLSEAVVLADELATFLNKRSYDRGIATLLIQLFDCKKEVVYQTLKRGKEIVRNACLSVLAGSTADLLRDAVPMDAVGSGLTSRMLFIYTSQLPPPVPRPRLSEAGVRMKEGIVEALGAMRRMRGPADLTPEAWKLYEQEYVRHRENSPLVLSPVLSGYASRWHYHALALSMIMAASETPAASAPLVHPRHLTASMKILAESEKFMPRVMTLITSTERGAMAELLAMSVSLMPKGVRKEDLLRGVSHRMTLREFEEAMSTLRHSGRVEVVSGPEGLVYFPKGER